MGLTDCLQRHDFYAQETYYATHSSSPLVVSSPPINSHAKAMQLYKYNNPDMARRLPQIPSAAKKNIHHVMVIPPDSLR